MIPLTDHNHTRDNATPESLDAQIEVRRQRCPKIGPDAERDTGRR